MCTMTAEFKVSKGLSKMLEKEKKLTERLLDEHRVNTIYLTQKQSMAKHYLDNI